MAGRLETLPTGPGEVWSPTWGPGGVARPLRRAERGLGALTESREVLGGVEEIGSSPWRVRRGREGLQKGAGGIEAQPRGQGRVVRPLRRAARGQESLPEGQEGSGVPPGERGGVRRAGRGWKVKWPSPRARKGREALLEVRVWSGGPPSQRRGRGWGQGQSGDRGWCEVSVKLRIRVGVGLRVGVVVGFGVGVWVNAGIVVGVGVGVRVWAEVRVELGLGSCLGSGLGWESRRGSVLESVSELGLGSLSW